MGSTFRELIRIEGNFADPELPCMHGTARQPGLRGGT
jgi:hypothetical protein